MLKEKKKRIMDFWKWKERKMRNDERKIKKFGRDRKRGGKEKEKGIDSLWKDKNR